MEITNRDIDWDGWTHDTDEPDYESIARFNDLDQAPHRLDTPEYIEFFRKLPNKTPGTFPWSRICIGAK